MLRSALIYVQKRSMQSTILFALKLITGFALLVLLFNHIGLEGYWNVLQTVQPAGLWIAAFLTIIAMLVGTINTYTLLIALDARVSFWRLFRYSTLSWALGTASPGKLGEFSLIFLLNNRENISIGKGLIVSFYDKMLTLVALFSFASYGCYAYLDFKTFLILTIISFAAITMVFAALWSDSSRNLAKRWVLRSYSVHFAGFSKNLKEMLLNKKRFLILNLLVTYLKWGIHFLVVQVIFHAFSYKLSFLSVAALVSLISFVALLPISINGLGVRESVGTYLTTLAGVPASIGANVFILLTTETYILALIYYITNHSLLAKNPGIVTINPSAKKLD